MPPRGLRFHCFNPSALHRFLTLGLGIRSSRQQFSRIMCRAGLGSTNWKPWRNALLLMTVAWTFSFPIRNLMYKSAISPMGNSTGSVAEKPRSLISSVLPETKPAEKVRICRSTYNLNLKSRRCSRRLSNRGISGCFSPPLRSNVHGAILLWRIAEAPSVRCNSNFPIFDPMPRSQGLQF